jgi:protein O-GlcNAc transferase
MDNAPSTSGPADLLAIAIGHQQAGRPDLAAATCRLLLKQMPENPNAMQVLGVSLQQLGRPDEAINLLRRSTELDPSVAAFWSNLGGVLGTVGRHTEAVPAFRQAIHLNPQHAPSRSNLGVSLEALGRFEEAAAAQREAIRIRPESAEAHHNLANALRSLGRYADALEAGQEAVAIRPDYPEALNNLGATLELLGRIDEARRNYARAASLSSQFLIAQNNLLISHRYRAEEHDAADLFAAHVQWAKRYAEPLYATIRPHDNDRDPDRRLRLGYVTPDFHEHPVTRFIEGVLEAHDRAAVEVVCYHSGRRHDAATKRIRAHADRWQDIARTDSETAAQLIRADGIDVLVDLAGHTGRQQMVLFARQPAPVQVAYLGYSDTTGLATVPYRITDAFCDPPGMTEHFYTEQLIRLRRCAWCYRPFNDSPLVEPLPADGNGGRITFGVLNRFSKVTEKLAKTWAAILAHTSGSTLVLAAPEDEGFASRSLVEWGVPAERIRLIAIEPAPQFLRHYNEIDIALDTYPHNGHTTTCDASWMGVPTVSLAGHTFVSRLGGSVLAALGLSELVAGTPAEYMTIAVALARDVPRLRALRLRLRSMFVRSQLADGRGLAAELEAAYRHVWGRYCVTCSPAN